MISATPSALPMTIVIDGNGIVRAEADPRPNAGHGEESIGCGAPFAAATICGARFIKKSDSTPNAKP